MAKQNQEPLDPDSPYNEGQPDADPGQQPVKGIKNPPGQQEQPEDDKLFHYDTYWLQYITKVLDETLPTMQTHLKGITTYLNTLSFTTFFGGIALSTYFQTAEISVFGWLIAAVVVLQMAKYFLKVKIGAPTITELSDLRSPELIHGTFNSFVEQMQRKLKLGGWVVGIATVAYLFCVPKAIYNYNNLEAPDFKDYTYISVDADKITLRGQLPKATYANLVITGKDPKSEEDKTLATQVLIGEHDKISTNLMLAKLQIVPETVRLEYVQNGQVKTYQYQAFSAKVAAEAAGEGAAATPDPYATDPSSGLQQAGGKSESRAKDSTAAKRDNTVKR